MINERIPVSITVHPWFWGHRFNNKTILPAVETIQLLAAEAQRKFPEVDVTRMSDIRFARFLEIPDGTRELDALIELEEQEQQLVCTLLSRTQLKHMIRLQEHGSLSFSLGRENNTVPDPFFVPALPQEGELRIATERIYEELVPFGPAYRTLCGELLLDADRAWGEVASPVLPGNLSVSGRLGSPFPLDGAFHAACVVGQRSADFVPFPVRIAERRVHHPTRPGRRYQISVEQLLGSREEFVFQLQISDQQGNLCESISGLRMRDVSRGTIRPPEWIRRRLN
jgi:hypothetical protein